MKKYLIVLTTDPYHAARDARFFDKKHYPKFGEYGHTRSIVLEQCNTLSEAQKMLTEYFITRNNGGSDNWGTNVITTLWKNDAPVRAYPSANDGTRMFIEDVYTYSIEIGEKEPAALSE